MKEGYFKKYYQDHKEEIDKRHKEWDKNNAEKRKVHKETYYGRNKEKLKAYSRKYHHTHQEEINRRKREMSGPIRVRECLGPIIKKKKLKPFMKRISTKLRKQIEYNTQVNKDKIKYYPMTDWYGKKNKI